MSTNRLASDIAREAVIVIAGAALAAFIVSRFPAFKKWVKESWA